MYNILSTGDVCLYEYKTQPVSELKCNPSYCPSDGCYIKLVCSAVVPFNAFNATLKWYWMNMDNEKPVDISSNSVTKTFQSFLISYLSLTKQYNLGYYWCHIEDPSYNQHILPSNRIQLFLTDKMFANTTCIVDFASHSNNTCAAVKETIVTTSSVIISSPCVTTSPNPTSYNSTNVTVIGITVGVCVLIMFIVMTSTFTGVLFLYCKSKQGTQLL